MRQLFALSIVFIGIFGSRVRAQDTVSQVGDALSTPAPRIEARRTEDTPVIDGQIDESVWGMTPEPRPFVQRTPDPGAASRQRSSIRVLYDDQAIYVALWLFDSAPDSIVGQLARRDVMPTTSDWVHVYIDSYNDRRTAFRFSVNPAGVKVDALHFDDTSEDVEWNAVWSVGTSVDHEGWKAEFAIPLSQLRFALVGGESAAWGLNVGRDIARYAERAYWAPVPPDGARFVSTFGSLSGLRDIPAPRRLEIQPYSVTRLTHTPSVANDPLHSTSDIATSLGADIRYGVTSDFTLSMAVNPDFGQVEADPSVVNLSAFESFFPEKRPFFTDGADLFRVSFPMFPDLFYSRRIGKAPSGGVPDAAAYSRVPEATTIVSAAKLTGKTSSGWSVGGVVALTAPERAEFVDAEGRAGTAPVEPLSAYTAARMVKDFRDGQSAVGGIVTGVNRALAGDLSVPLHAAAYVAGVDGRHRFGGGHWEVAGSMLGSQVRGAPDAITATQRASQRYFQRPDAAHVSLDSARTTLSGGQVGLRVSKLGGGHLRGEVSSVYTSPGFEHNDLGFQFRADRLSFDSRITWDEFRPTGPFRQWRASAIYSSGWTTGGERTWSWVQLFANGQFANLWSVNAGIDRTFPALSVTTLRGGPAIQIPGYVATWLGVQTDTRRVWSAYLFAHLMIDDENTSRTAYLFSSIAVRPSARLDVRLEPSIQIDRRDAQYVAAPEYLGEPLYLFGRLDHTTTSLTARVNYTFSPTLSLEAYAEPFVSSGRYTTFNRVTNPKGRRFTERFAPLSSLALDPTGERYAGDVDGDGTVDVTFARPDFTSTQLRSNLVLRWEYRPGSTLFLVWSQDRAAYEQIGTFDVRRSLDALFERGAGRNVFLVKLSYWLAR